MENEEDLRDWEICRRVNEIFYEKTPARAICILCSAIVDPSHQQYASTLWKMTGCWGGHSLVGSVENTEETPCICDECNIYFPLNVAKATLTCRRAGCRRVIRISTHFEQSPVCTEAAFADVKPDFARLLIRRNTYECCVLLCQKQHGITKASRRPPTPECDHDRNACDDCLTTLFRTALDGKSLEALVCPDSECRKPIPGDEVRRLAPDLHRTYCKLRSYKMMSEKPGFRWCTNPDCGEGQVHAQGATAPVWSCKKCSRRHCFICRDNTSGTCQHIRDADQQRVANRTHQRRAGFEVLQAKKRALMDGSAETEREKLRISKACPKKGCGNRIQRDGGCAHMECRKPRGCGTHFCWLCKVIWENGGRSTKHLKSCKLGSDMNREERSSIDNEGYADGWDHDIGYDLDLDSDQSLHRYRFE